MTSPSLGPQISCSLGAISPLVHVCPRLEASWEEGIPGKRGRTWEPREAGDALRPLAVHSQPVLSCPSPDFLGVLGETAT